MSTFESFGNFSTNLHHVYVLQVTLIERTIEGIFFHANSLHVLVKKSSRIIYSFVTSIHLLPVWLLIVVGKSLRVVIAEMIADSFVRSRLSFPSRDGRAQHSKGLKAREAKRRKGQHGGEHKSPLVVLGGGPPRP